MSQPRTLPPEILHEIMDHLHDDREALQTCSVVCADWEPAARYHLFKPIMSASPQMGSLSELISLLTSYDDIARRISHFSLSGYRDISFTDLEAILKPLTGLRSLELANVSISKPWSSEPEVVTGPVVRALGTLSIKDCSIIQHGRVDIFFRLLALFGDIDELKLSIQPMLSTGRGVRKLDSLESLIGFILPDHVQIATLSLGSLPLRFLAQLCHPWSLPFWSSIRAISIGKECASWDVIKHLGKVLTAPGVQFHSVALEASHKLVVPPELGCPGALGFQLRTLRLILALGNALANPAVPDQIKDTKEEWKALRLKRCSTLKVFTVTFDHSDRDGHRYGREIFGTTVDLLTDLPSSIQEVRISMIPGPDDSHLNPPNVGSGSSVQPSTLLLEVFDWHALDKILSVPRFKNLKVILEVVRLKDTLTRQRCSQILNNIRRSLPLLSSRNMLAFGVRDRN